jgi:hypothetical protein
MHERLWLQSPHRTSCAKVVSVSSPLSAQVSTKCQFCRVNNAPRLFTFRHLPRNPQNDASVGPKCYSQDRAQEILNISNRKEIRKSREIAKEEGRRKRRKKKEGQKEKKEKKKIFSKKIKSSIQRVYIPSNLGAREGEIYT